jgi:hypothetical protein
MANLISSGDWAILDFPWTTCSIWSHPFFNKEWLFHIYLIPFTLLFGNITGAKIAISVTALLIALAWGNLFKTLKIKNILFAMLFILFSTGYIYIGRLILCRSFLISILFMPLALNFMFRKKGPLLAVTIYLYMLAYVGAWQMLPLIFIFDTFSFFLSDKKQEMKKLMLPWGIIGVTAGIIITPYFPVNINAIFTQTILILKAQWFGVEKAGTLPMGTELAPIPLKHIIYYIPIFSLAAFALYDLFNRKIYRKTGDSSNANGNVNITKNSSGASRIELYTLIIFTALYMVMTLFTQKFIEYSLPLFTLTIFLYWETYPLPAWKSKCIFYTPESENDCTLSNLRKKCTILLLIISALFSSFQLQKSFYRKNLIYQDSTEWIKKNIPEKRVIFSGDWDDNVILFYYLTDYKFLVLLDPYFMYAESPEKFMLWQKIAEGKVEETAMAIETTFNTNVVFVPPDRQRLRHRLLMDKKSKMVYEGKSGESIFLLTP